jgi:hypothetical protein
MELPKPLIEYLTSFVLSHPVVSISGESGTGKTSLALYLIGNLVENPVCCIWIQASEPFPRARLECMFQKDDDQREYILQNIYIAPKKVFHSYSDQTHFCSTFLDSLFPPDLKFIIIDNISHHLRYELTTKIEINQKVRLMDEFYDTLIYPLILKCLREKVTLILLHEVSFDVSAQKSRPFFYKLYERIKGVQVILNKTLFSQERTMEINTGRKKVLFNFTMREDGFYYI